VISTSSSYWSY